MAVHTFGEIDWIDAMLGTVFTFLAVMAFELPSRLGFGFTDSLGLGIDGVTLTVATVGSVVCIAAALATNGIEGDWKLAEYLVVGAMGVIIVGFIAVPFIRDAIMSNELIAMLALLIEGVGFALIAYY
jgi:hypothetical protein